MKSGAFITNGIIDLGEHSTLCQNGLFAIVVLNSKSDNSNISALTEFDSDAGLVSSNCFLAFGVPCNFLLKAGCDVVGKRN